MLLDFFTRVSTGEVNVAYYKSSFQFKSRGLLGWAMNKEKKIRYGHSAVLL